MWGKHWGLSFGDMIPAAGANGRVSHRVDSSRRLSFHHEWPNLNPRVAYFGQYPRMLVRWAISVLLEVDAIKECEEHGWIEGPHRSARA